MDWKKRYAPLKKGDKVRVLAINHLCPHSKDYNNCCDKYVGKIAKVCKVMEPSMITRGTISVSIPEGNCTFPTECLKKV